MIGHKEVSVPNTYLLNQGFKMCPGASASGTFVYSRRLSPAMCEVLMEVDVMTSSGAYVAPTSAETIGALDILRSAYHDTAGIDVFSIIDDYQNARAPFLQDPTTWTDWMRASRDQCYTTFCHCGVLGNLPFGMGLSESSGTGEIDGFGISIGEIRVTQPFVFDPATGQPLTLVQVFGGATAHELGHASTAGIGEDNHSTVNGMSLTRTATAGAAGRTFSLTADTAGGGFLGSSGITLQETTLNSTTPPLHISFMGQPMLRTIQQNVVQPINTDPVYGTMVTATVLVPSVTMDTPFMIYWQAIYPEIGISPLVLSTLDDNYIMFNSPNGPDNLIHPQWLNDPNATGRYSIVAYINLHNSVWRQPAQ